MFRLARSVLSSSSRRTTTALTSSRSSLLALRSVTTHSQLPEEHKMIYDMCRNFADAELAPHAGEWDQKHEFPRAAVKQLVR